MPVDNVVNPSISNGSDEPDICNLLVGEDVPIPTQLPVITNAFELNVPPTTLLSLNTSRIGRPDISFTLNSEPLKLSSTANNEPLVPSTLNTIDPALSEPLLFIFKNAFGVIVPIPTLPDGVIHILSIGISVVNVPIFVANTKASLSDPAELTNLVPIQA